MRALPRPTPLRLQIALQGNCLTRAGVACISQAYATQAPGCSAGELSDTAGVACTSQAYAARVQVLGRCTKAQTLLGLRSVSFPGPAAQGTRCLARSLSPGGARLAPASPQSPASVCAAGVRSRECPGCPGELVSAALLPDVNCPGPQEDLVSNWEPARSLPGDAVSGAEIAPRLPALAAARLLPASGGGCAGPLPASSPLVFAQSFVL